MTTELTIDPEFAALCPPLNTEETSLLEASIEADGCRDPIIVWANSNNIILDGHNRYRICRQFGRDFKVKALTFATREEVVNWIIDNQLGRRNLSEEQKGYLRGKKYHAEKKTEGAPEGNQNAADEKQLAHNEPVVSTAERLGKEYGVSPATIKRDAKFAEAVDAIDQNVGPEAKKNILAGKSGLTKKQIIDTAKLPAAEQKKRLTAPKDTKPKGKAKTQLQIDYACRELNRTLTRALRNCPPSKHHLILRELKNVLLIDEVECELTFWEPPREPQLNPERVKQIEEAIRKAGREHPYCTFDELVGHVKAHVPPEVCCWQYFWKLECARKPVPTEEEIAKTGYDEIVQKGVALVVRRLLKQMNNPPMLKSRSTATTTTADDQIEAGPESEATE